jgi:2-dehydro-3-deoxyphosphogluconate aldolase / (4S)-4-hydroxy-2-oxoglutarate aldolase
VVAVSLVDNLATGGQPPVTPARNLEQGRCIEKRDRQTGGLPLATVTEEITRRRLVPVMVIERSDDAWPLAQALKAGGLTCIEVTLRTAQAIAALSAISGDPDVLVGAGTVLRPSQVEAALEAGARFIVTPGFSSEVVRACQANSVPVFPGVATATEVQMALEAGIEVVKFFPAESIGGLGLIKALAGPFPMMRFIPTGGIGPGNVRQYLSFPPVVAVGGSWMATAAKIAAGQFDEITALAAEAAALCADGASQEGGAR